VIVISRRALKSKHPWVFAEVNMLALRMEQPDFQVIPVLIEGVQLEDLGSRWEPTGLHDRGGVIEKDPSIVAKAVVELLAPTRERIASSPAARLLETLLAPSSASSPDLLRSAAKNLSGPDVPDPVARELARRLLRAPREEIVAVAADLVLANELGAQATLRFALPFTWVDQHAARALDRAMRDGRLAALNAKEMYTTHCYLICGMAKPPPWTVRGVSLLQGEHLPELVDDAVREIIYAGGGLTEEPGLRVPPPSTPTVLVFDVGHLTTDVVECVRKRFGKDSDYGIVFLAHRQNSADLPTAVSAEEIEFVSPELDPALESEARRFYNDSQLKVQAQHDAVSKLLTGTLT
jgi:hypothetical protein